MDALTLLFLGLALFFIGLAGLATLADFLDRRRK
jgi:hypothetical protein